MSEETPVKSGGQGWVRALVDYAAPLGFVVAYFVTRDMVQATGVLVVLSIVALAVGWLVEKRIAPLPLIGGLGGIVFGGLTLLTDDPRWIKAKPTIVNITFAVALAGGMLAGKNPLKALLGSAIQLEDRTWRTLTIRYIVFFLIVAAANEAVWRTQPDATWALWRFPGLQLLALLFTLTQLPLMMKGIAKPAAESPDRSA